jgi:murein DD-endopeptidase MepM/ murein hydrolase activator NlpD
MYRLKWPIKGSISGAFTRKKSIFAVALLCIFVIGAALLWVRYYGSESSLPEEPVVPDEAEYLEQVADIEPPVAEAQAEPEQNQDEKPESQPIVPTIQEPEAKPVVAEAQEVNVKAMAIPVAGKKIKGFATDKLVYSETLKQWQTHNGIDISAEVGASVKAALPGTVDAVYDDPMLGQVVILDHGNGYKTLYANLNQNVLVKEGADIKKGQVIGAVGETAQFEAADPPHLHFEVFNGETRVDPDIYLPKID